MRTILGKLYHGCGVAAAFCVFMIAFSVVAEIIVRMFGMNLPGVIEIATFGLVGASFLSLADTFRHNIHIRVMVLTQHLPPRARRFVELWALTVAVAVSLWLAYWSAEMAWEAYQYGDRSNGLLAIPLWIPQGLMTGGILLLAISAIEEFVNVWRGRETTYEKRARGIGDDGEPLPISDLHQES